MYPAEQTTTVEVVKRTDVLCGQQRPGHFAWCCNCTDETI